MALEDFVAKLPINELTAEEVALFDLLEEIGKIVLGFLPRAVSVQDWASRRCPDHKVDSVNASGLVAVSCASTSVCLSRNVIGSSRQAQPWYSRNSFSDVRHENADKGQAETLPPWHRAMSSTSRPEDATHRTNNGRTGAASTQARCDGLRPATTSALQPSNDVFFAGLPQEVFLDEELHLRDALRGVLRRANRARQKGGSHSIANIELLPNIIDHMQTFLPPKVPLLEWVERRMYEEIDILQDDHGAIVLKIARKSEEQKAQEFQDFFDGLPEDEFTMEELALRDSLTAFLATWHEHRSPKLTEVGLDPDVSHAKKQLLPEFVGLAAWIELRLGTEIELQKLESGQHMFGWPGTLKLISETEQRGAKRQRR